MAEVSLGEAIDHALAEAMAEDERIVLIGEDVQMLRPALYGRFGARRVIAAPISEAAFVGASVSAAMAGLRPVVEVMLVDFIGVAMDAVLNHMAKVEAFSGGRWRVPLVLRATCGGGYGDGGQHEQSLWGMLGGIAGLSVAVPSTPQDAAGLMKGALSDGGPVIVLEHKLLSNLWLEAMGRGGRDSVRFDVPEAGSQPRLGPVESIALGRAVVRRAGSDVSLISLAVGAHRALQAAERLRGEGVSCEVLDLRCVRPLDRESVLASVAKTSRLVVIDEDYREQGLSGELAAVVLEAGLRPAYRRVCCDGVIPYDRRREVEVLPNVDRIVRAVHEVLD